MADKQKEASGGSGTESAGKVPAQASLFRQVAEAFPESFNGWLVPEKASSSKNVEALVWYRQPDLETSDNHDYMRTFSIASASSQEEKNNIRCTSAFPWELKGALMVSPSPSGKQLIIVRRDEKQKECTKRNQNCLIEVWDEGRMRSIIPTKGKHGAIYCDALFGRMEWSHDEQRVAYVAERFQDDSSCPTFWQVENEKDEKKLKGMGKAKEFREDWGEGYIGFSQPQLFILDLTKKKVQPVRGIPSTLAAGEPQWNKDDSSLFFAGWETEPRRLGFIYCINRPSAVYEVPIQEESVAEDDEKSKKERKEDGEKEEILAIRLSSDKEDKSVHSVRLNPAGTTLIYLSYDVLSTHQRCAALRAIDLNSDKTRGEPRTVVPIVAAPSSIESFPGIYSSRLQRRCWLDNENVVFASSWRSVNKLLQVNVSKQDSSAAVLVLSDGIVLGSNQQVKAETLSWGVLDVSHDGQHILATASNACTPRFPLYARISSSTSTVWTALPGHELDEKSAAWLADVTFEVQQVEPTTNRGDETSSKILPFESVLVYRKASNDDKQPLIVMPHGGPHSIYTIDFASRVLYFCNLGYAVLLVNYRGSIGFGQEVLDSLPGKCGRQDCDDVMDAVHHALRSSTFLDADRLVIFGGSHGGFLAAHLASTQTCFKAAVLWNPVINFVSMAGTSDIPDWVFVEALGVTSVFDTALTPERYAQMHQGSPIAYAPKCKTPSLITLGLSDRRVPPSQGMEFYYVLKNNGIPVKALVYPDNGHPIPKVDAYSDVFVQVALWFEQYLSS